MTLSLHEHTTRTQHQLRHKDRLWRHPSQITTANTAMPGWSCSRARPDGVRFSMCPRNMMAPTVVSVVVFLLGLRRMDILETFEMSRCELRSQDAYRNTEAERRRLTFKHSVTANDCTQAATRTSARSCIAMILCEAVRVSGPHFIAEVRSILQLHDHYLAQRGVAELAPLSVDQAEQAKATVTMLRAALWERVRDLEACSEAPGHLHEGLHAWIPPLLLHVADAMVDEVFLHPISRDSPDKFFARQDDWYKEQIGLHQNAQMMQVPMIDLCSEALKQCILTGRRHACTKHLVSTLNATLRSYCAVFKERPFRLG